MRDKLARFLPFLQWGQRYSRHVFTQDLIAAVIVTIMLIPQSLAYALLAGLPAQVGLYASILPLVAYAVFGTSMTLAVGPVAVLSLMTASAAGSFAPQGSPEYIAAALVLALLSGAMLLIMGVLRFGFLANFLSHPVIAGFITASGVIIALSQLKHILGIAANGHTLQDIVGSLLSNIDQVNLATSIIGVASLILLFWVKSGLKRSLMSFGLSDHLSGIIARTGPMFAVVGGIATVFLLGLDALGVQIVGDVPQGLPGLAVPVLDLRLWTAMIIPAALIALVGFVESVSVAQTLASKRRERINPDQELIGLGAASIAAGFSGGYPVTGGFARSAVNFDAGAKTPAAGFLTAVGIALATVSLTPLLYFLPKATLAATIIVAVLSLIDLTILKRTWNYSKQDFIAVSVTIISTLFLGVEMGIVSGVVVSIALFVYKTSRPHIAEVGLVPDTEHFRNIKRHQVETCNSILTLRVDESLYFANARNLEDFIYNRVVNDCNVKHLVLMCSAINEIDSSALESLESINHRLETMGIKFHLSEVKGPVMDRLKKTSFPEDLTGRIYLSQYHAHCELDEDASLNEELLTAAQSKN